MPRAKKQCANTNCNNYTIAQSYCDDCTLQRAFKGSNNVTINSNIRMAIRRRDNDTCYLCGNAGTIVDHIVPQVLGGSNDPSNLACICQPCHNAKTRTDGRVKRRVTTWSR